MGERGVGRLPACPLLSLGQMPAGTEAESYQQWYVHPWTRDETGTFPSKGNGSYPEELQGELVETVLVKSLLRVGEGGEEHSRELAQKPSGPILTYLTLGKSVILCLVDKDIIVQRGRAICLRSHSRWVAWMGEVR